MRMKAVLACAGLLAGVLVALSPSAAHAAPTRYEAETSPAVCAGTIDSNWAGFSGSGFCNGNNAAGALRAVHRQRLGRGHRDAGRPLRQRHHDRPPGRPDRQRRDRADRVVRGHRRLDDLGHQDPDRDGQRGQQHHPAQPDHRRRPAQHRLPRLRGREPRRRRPTRCTWRPTATTRNPGTLGAPLQTIQRAVDLAQPGYTIDVRGGTYAPSTNIQLLKNGTSSQPITLRNYNSERVDHRRREHAVHAGRGRLQHPARRARRDPHRGRLLAPRSAWRSSTARTAIFGLDTNNNVFDRLITRDNYESGLHLQGASSNNQIINLDSYGNRDPRKNGESADGLAIKEGSGTGNVVRGARLWNNSDDGLDFWMFLSPILRREQPRLGQRVQPLEPARTTPATATASSWAAATWTCPPSHTVRNSMAWDNAVGGFIDNANPGQHADRPLHRLGQRRHRLRLRRRRQHADQEPRGGQRHRGLARLDSSGSGNSWDIGGTWTFASTDPSTITGPRAADGSIPSSTFLRPSNGADVGARF